LADTTEGVNTGAAYVYEPESAPMVSVAPADASAAEAGPDPGVFTITRTGDTTTPLTVLYTLGGSASNDSAHMLAASQTQQVRLRFQKVTRPSLLTQPLGQEKSRL